METVTIGVYSIVGDSFCVAADDGDAVYSKIKAAFNAGKHVRLSFKNVEMLTSAFLNTAIGQLYGEYSEEEVRESLSVSDISDEDKLLIKRVTDTAKVYYKDPDRLSKSIAEILEED